MDALRIWGHGGPLEDDVDHRTPNLIDPAAARRGFSWTAARDELTGLPDGGLNVAYEAVSRHAAGPRAHAEALRFVRADGRRHSVSYRQLDDRMRRFAARLRSIGVGKGDVVCTLLGRQPELYVAALGALARGAVFCPLFAALGPEPVEARLARGHARVLVTTERAYRTKVAPARERLPDLRHIVLVDDETSWSAFQADPSAGDEIEGTSADDPALLHFTSGTTGAAKGALHGHAVVIAHHTTGRWVLDLRPCDVFWCTADPGWVTGTCYGIIAPLVCGATLLVDEGGFEPRRWYSVLRDESVTVWYTAPTAIRMLMKAGPDLLPTGGFPKLRHVASVGEPLNAEAVQWGAEALGRPVHDTWWQTETGAICIANLPAEPLVPGSMGRPIPGIEAAIARREGAHLIIEDAPDSEGLLVLRAPWPSMFRTYVYDEARYRKCFADGWYITGDRARRDAEGRFWFVGRQDDLIKSSGHLIGPCEVERTLMAHPAVVDAGVIGKPDPVAGEIVKAFVELHAGVTPDESLRRDILAYARRRLGPAVAPKELKLTDALPRNRSGKILRRVLKAQEVEQGDVG